MNPGKSSLPGKYEPEARSTSPPCLPHAFTLIELLAVMTLVAVIAGAVTVNLDGFTERGRLRSAAHQIAAIDRLARIEAVSAGEPRRMVYESQSSRCLIQRPFFDGHGWRWSDGQVLNFATRLSLDRLVVNDHSLGAGPAEVGAIRIRADGTSPTYACVLSTGGMAVAVVIDGVTGAARYLFDIEAAGVDASILNVSELGT